MKKIFKYKVEILVILVIAILTTLYFTRDKVNAPVAEIDNKVVTDFENYTNPFENFKISDIENGYLKPTKTSQDGSVNDFRYVFGRFEEDIKSKQIYSFSQPKDITVEIQGVDAQSSLIVFRRSGDEIFTVTQYDHTSVNILVADQLNFSQVQGHTIMVHPGNNPEDSALNMFRGTLYIGSEKAFK